MIRKVRNCCETCENLVCIATTIGQLQHSEYLKSTFLDTLNGRWFSQRQSHILLDKEIAICIRKLPYHSGTYSPMVLLFITTISRKPLGKPLVHIGSIMTNYIRMYPFNGLDYWTGLIFCCCFVFLPFIAF